MRRRTPAAAAAAVAAAAAAVAMLLAALSLVLAPAPADGQRIGARPRVLPRDNPVPVPPGPPRFRGRIVGGRPVSDADEAFGARFMVKLLLRQGGSGQFAYYCAGSLVSRDKVVTAAHCVIGAPPPGPGGDIVRIGGLTLTDGIQRDFARVDIHPDFDFITFRCDYAVVTIADPPTDEEYAAAGIVYARLNYNPYYPSLGKTVTLTGWGATAGTSTAVSPTLQVTRITRDRFRRCVEYLQARDRITLGLSVKLMICFSLGDTTSSCRGDSGAPVWRFFEKPGFRSYWRIYGLVSFGYADADNPTDACPVAYPDFYARLSAARPWFESVL